MSKFVGALIALAVDVLGHLIASIIERQSFFDQLVSVQGIIILIALVLIGIIAGILVEKFHQSSSASGNPKKNSVRQTITASRGGKVSNSPQSVKGDVAEGEIKQGMKATKKGEIKGSGQSIDLT